MERGIVVNREVEIRPHISSWGNPGECVDIQVNAINNLTNEVLAVIIEVKCCWHRELKAAMETQLCNRYLKDNACQYGIYLVGWFNCESWDKEDPKKQAVPAISIADAKRLFISQADSLSKNGLIIKSFVMNTGLR